MSKKRCEICDYETVRQSDLNRHKETEKHKIKMEKFVEESLKILSNKKKKKIIKRDDSTNESSNNDSNSTDNSDSDKSHKIQTIKRHYCMYCGNEFSHQQSKWKHENFRCHKRTEILRKKPDNEKLAELEKKNEELTKSVTRLIGIIENNSEANKSSSKATSKVISALAYVTKHYTKAPVLEKIEEKTIVKMLEHKVPKGTTSSNVIISKHGMKILPKYLGDMIITEYYKFNSDDQSFWGSDVDRLTFVIRQGIKNGGKEWIKDPDGLKVKKLIIDPMLTYVFDMMFEYVDKNDTLIQNDNDNELDKSTMTEKMTLANDIMSMIKTHKLQKQILRHIAPEFKIKSLKDIDG